MGAQKVTVTFAKAHGLQLFDVVECVNVVKQVLAIEGPQVTLGPVPSRHVRGCGGVVADVVAGMLYAAASNLLDAHDRKPVRPTWTTVGDDSIAAGFTACLCRDCFAACGLLTQYEN